MRPKTLAQVAQWTRDGASFDLCLAEFLDEFQIPPDAAAIEEAPGLLVESPAAFRSRNLFVSANALSRVQSARARRHAEHIGHAIKPWRPTHHPACRPQGATGKRAAV